MTTATVQRTVHAVPTTDGARLHATVSGSPDAPVTLVLAHGWTLDALAAEARTSVPTLTRRFR